ncbi:MAG: hypothetical protein WD826_02520 [Actinomycetota bacterium]
MEKPTIDLTVADVKASAEFYRKLGVEVQALEAKFAELVDAGYIAHLAPIDAFWGSRYAVADDPDGNHIGLMGPRDGEHTTATLA